jgi:hypothetical protein
MSGDDLSVYSEVVDLGDVAEVNRYLELGWRIVQAYVVNSPNTAREDRNEQPHYVLGWRPGVPNLEDLEALGEPMPYMRPKGPRPEELVGGTF